MAKKPFGSLSPIEFLTQSFVQLIANIFLYGTFAFIIGWSYAQFTKYSSLKAETPVQSETLLNMLEKYMTEVVEAFQATDINIGKVNILELASYGMFPILFAAMPPFIKKTNKSMEEFCTMLISATFTSIVKPTCEKFGCPCDANEFDKLVWNRFEMYSALHLKKMSNAGPNFPGIEDEYSKFIELFTGNPTGDEGIRLAFLLQTKYTNAFMTFSDAIIESNPLKR